MTKRRGIVFTCCIISNKKITFVWDKHLGQACPNRFPAYHTRSEETCPMMHGHLRMGIKNQTSRYYTINYMVLPCMVLLEYDFRYVVILYRRQAASSPESPKDAASRSEERGYCPDHIVSDRGLIEGGEEPFCKLLLHPAGTHGFLQPVIEFPFIG